MISNGILFSSIRFIFFYWIIYVPKIVILQIKSPFLTSDFVMTLTCNQSKWPNTPLYEEVTNMICNVIVILLFLN